jgi:hypothetical protein
VAREVKVSGRTVYLPDREEWEETPTLWRCPSCGVETTCRERAEKLGHSRPPHKIGLCVTKMEPVKPEETPTKPTPRAGPYALTVEVSGFVEHELYEGPPGLGYGVSDVVSGQIQCSSCGAPRDNAPGLDHWVVAPGGWRRCGEWR